MNYESHILEHKLQNYLHKEYPIFNCDHILNGAVEYGPCVGLESVQSALSAPGFPQHFYVPVFVAEPITAQAIACYCAVPDANASCHVYAGLYTTGSTNESYPADANLANGIFPSAEQPLRLVAGTDFDVAGSSVSAGTNILTFPTPVKLAAGLYYVMVGVTSNNIFSFRGSLGSWTPARYGILANTVSFSMSAVTTLCLSGISVTAPYTKLPVPEYPYAANHYFYSYLVHSSQ